VLFKGSEPVPGFRLQTPLGQGAFGEVWAARTRDGSSVALKFLDTRKRDSAVLRGEIRILRALSEVGHPNLIRLLGVHACSHYLILCMERADGNLEELRQTYRQVSGRNISPDHLLELLRQAAIGLDYIAGLKLPGFNLASTGLQHCDVKPSNLLLLGDEVKIADFGLCASQGEQTHKHGWRGTIPYAAPELFRGRASPTTDQFSLAVTYCDLVAGDRVLLRSSQLGVESGMGVDLSKLRERERMVLERALSPDPTRRWPSCQAFVSALREAANPVRSESESGRRASRPSLSTPPAPVGHK
jgi:serine/threonine protein kinase